MSCTALSTTRGGHGRHMPRSLTGLSPCPLYRSDAEPLPMDAHKQGGASQSGLRLELLCCPAQQSRCECPCERPHWSAGGSKWSCHVSRSEGLSKREGRPQHSRLSPVAASFQVCGHTLALATCLTNIQLWATLHPGPVAQSPVGRASPIYHLYHPSHPADVFLAL